MTTTRETWRRIKELDGEYYVSNLGRLRNGKGPRARILKTWVSRNQECVTIQSASRKLNTTMANLVLRSFRPPQRKDSERPMVRHLNGDSLDNRLKNLEWRPNSVA